jgi:signal transduction histidine kinase
VNRLWTITQVLSNTVHAVKNSLQVTGGNAELLESREGLDPAIVRRAQTIRAQAMRASDALEALLAYSRPASESVDVVELGDLARMALEMRSHSLGRARITSDVTGTEGGPYLTRARRRDLLQLLLNLLLGSEAVITGWSGAKIVVGLGRRGSDVVIEVSASGSRASGAAEGPAGEFGLDLQQRVMKRLAAELGGVLECELSKEGGPKLALALPAEDAAASAASARSL